MRGNVIQIRVSDEEKQRISELAEARGTKMSEYIRLVALGRTPSRLDSASRQMYEDAVEAGLVKPKSSSSKVEGSTCPKCHMGTVVCGKCTNCRKVF